MYSCSAAAECYLGSPATRGRVLSSSIRVTTSKSWTFSHPPYAPLHSTYIQIRNEKQFGTKFLEFAAFDSSYNTISYHIINIIIVRRTLFVENFSFFSFEETSILHRATTLWKLWANSNLVEIYYCYFSKLFSIIVSNYYSPSSNWSVI